MRHFHVHAQHKGCLCTTGVVVVSIPPLLMPPWMHAWCCRAPVIVSAEPTGPRDVLVVLNPPASGPPVLAYLVKLCPIPPYTGRCVNTTCPTINCPVTGLRPSTKYNVTADATLQTTVKVPASNSLELMTPPLTAPTLTSAAATSSTTGTASAAPPPGMTCTQVRLRG